ncbi:MAG: DUF2946 family protein [Ideonella sp.]
MDDLVKAALLKWPNVPACRGWLALDARGEWFLRDEQAQAAGPFPGSKGSHIEHRKLREFIERNYAADPDGAWFFQNGPQRVYVELEAAPWIWRLESAGAQGGAVITSHTGLSARFSEALTDENGRLFLVTDRGLGLVHTQDMAIAAEQIDSTVWALDGELPFASLPGRYGFVLSPQAAAAASH